MITHSVSVKIHIVSANKVAKTKFYHERDCKYTSGGFRGGVRGVRPPKIRKAYVIQR